MEKKNVGTIAHDHGNSRINKRELVHILKEKKVLVVDDGSNQVKEALKSLDLAHQIARDEARPLSIVLETAGREESRRSVEALGSRKIRASPFIPMMIGMMGIASSYGGDPTGGFWPEPPKPTKKCLIKSCRKEHKHNNSFCSTECCKAYKLKNKGGKRDGKRDTKFEADMGKE